MLGELQYGQDVPFIELSASFDDSFALDEGYTTEYTALFADSFGLVDDLIVKFIMWWGRFKPGAVFTAVAKTVSNWTVRAKPAVSWTQVDKPHHDEVP